MKKLLLLAVMVLAAVNLTGCVNFHSQTDIKSDGSGTAVMNISISEAVEQAIIDMKAIDPNQSGEVDFPMLDELKKADLEKAGKSHGVKVTKFDKAVADGRKNLTIELAFEDLKGLSYVMGKIMGEEDKGDGLGIFDAGDGNFVLRQARYEFPPEPADEAAKEAPESAEPQAVDPAQMQKQMEVMGVLMGAMSELDVSFAITVPGDVVSSNAPATDGRTSTWSINAGNMMTADQNMDPEIVFSGKGLKIKPLTE